MRRRSPRRVVLPGLLLVVGALPAVLVGCRGPRVGPVTEVVRKDPCLLGPEAERAGSITLAVNQNVLASDAPVPRNDAERVVFRQLYETLVRVDCTGRVRPGLAASWGASDHGRVWRFTLRPGLGFWDGTPVWARAVRDSWRASREGCEGVGSCPIWAWIDPDSVTVSGQNQLRVALREPLGREPEIFAHPALAVAKDRGRSRWPMGTGPFRIRAEAGGETGTGTLELEPVRAMPGSRIRVLVSAGADPRDLLGRKVDAMLIRNREALDYAANLPDFTTRSLSWDRVYFLMSPLIATTAPGGRPPASELYAFRRDLAHNAAAGDARPAAPFAFDTTEAAACSDNDLFGRSPPGGKVSPDVGSARRILYVEGDEDGRRLAARFVALAAAPESMSGSDGFTAEVASLLAAGGGPPKAVGVSRDRFATALAKGDDVAYVLPLSRSLEDPCLEIRLLVDTCRWLRRASWPPGGRPERDRLAESALPLIATRPHLVMRRGLTGLRIDGDGTLLLDRAGWTGGRAIP
jgi:hypothetical protein